MICFKKLSLSALLLLASPITTFGRLSNGKDATELHRNLSVTSMPAIVTVIDSTTDLIELCYAFQTLVRAKSFPNAPIYAFHGLPLSDKVLDELQNCTNHDATFVDITSYYHHFPPGFTPTEGVDYDKQQTENFFASTLWELPHVQAHDVILRISDSTCLTQDNYDLPDFSSTLPHGYSKEKLMYQSQTIPGSFVLGYRSIANLFDSVVEYMSKREIYPKNFKLWFEILDFHEKFNSLPKFENSFEIVRKEFMLRKDVRDFHSYIVKNHSEEFFNSRWSNEVIRYLTVAIFGDPHETYIMHVNGFMEKDFLQGKLYEGVCRLGPFGTLPQLE